MFMGAGILVALSLILRELEVLFYIPSRLGGHLGGHLEFLGENYKKKMSYNKN